MSGPVCVAMLGFGHEFHSSLWAEALRDHPRADFRYVWDHDAVRAEEHARRWEAEFIADLDALLARDDLDAVAICSENNRHADLVVAAARAGKPVLCEKPMATTFADCDRIRRSVRAAGVMYFQSFPKRFDPVNIAVRELLDAGTIGRPILARIRHGHGGALTSLPGTEAYRASWFRDPAANGGGAFLDEGVHATDLLAWLFGMPDEVSAHMTRLDPNARADEAGVAVYRFADGRIVEVCSGTVFAAATNTVEVWGDRGAVVVTGTDLASREFTEEPDVRVYVTTADDRAWRTLDVPTGFRRADFHRRAVAAFVDGVCDGTQPAVGLDDAERALELVLAAYESARTRRAVRFPFREDRPYRVSEF